MSKNKKRERPEWMQTLPADWTAPYRESGGSVRECPLCEHPALEKYASKDEAVKALVHAQRLLGRTPEGFMPLPDGNDPESMERVWSMLGRPESPDGYAVPDLDLPEDMAVSEDFHHSFAEKAHELGMSAAQATGLYEWFLPRVVEMREEMSRTEGEEKSREFEALRSVHMGRTQDVMENARRAAFALGGEELLDALDRTGAGNSSAVICAFARMAPMLLEGGIRGGGSPSPELTREKLEQMMRDPRYHDPLQRDADWVRSIEEGFRRLYPGSHQPGSQVGA